MDALRSIQIKTSMNEMIFLDHVASITEGEGPIQIVRENQVREESVLANILVRSLGQVSKDIKQKTVPIEQTLSSGYFIEFGGQYQGDAKCIQGYGRSLSAGGTSCVYGYGIPVRILPPSIGNHVHDSSWLNRSCDGAAYHREVHQSFRVDRDCFAWRDSCQ